MIYIILIISFLLDNFFLFIIEKESLLFPLCTLMSLVIIFPFFRKDNHNKFLIICAFLGMLYDLVFAQTILLNIGLFLLIGIMIKIVFKLFSTNIISNLLTAIIIILVYRIINYFILCMSGYFSFSLLELIRGIYSSLIVNLIYIIVFYGLSILISNKFKIQRFS